MMTPPGANTTCNGNGGLNPRSDAKLAVSVFNSCPFNRFLNLASNLSTEDSRIGRFLRRTDGVFGWHRNKRTYKRKRNGERCPASRRTAVEYLKRGESRVTGQPAADMGRGRQPAKTVGEERKPDE